MSEHQENSIVHAVEPLTDSFHRLTLHAPLIAAAAQPGQFVMVACGPSLDPLLRRPFSIHRRIGAEQIQLLFRVVGRGTKLLSELRPGQALSLIGPLGRGFGPVPADSVCFVGGGIGIAPLLFLADRWHRSDQACTVLLGSRTGDELTQLACRVRGPWLPHRNSHRRRFPGPPWPGHRSAAPSSCTHPKSICVWSACDDGHGGRVMPDGPSGL